jgi:hypothetical protein
MKGGTEKANAEGHKKALENISNKKAQRKGWTTKGAQRMRAGRERGWRGLGVQRERWVLC